MQILGSIGLGLFLGTSAAMATEEACTYTLGVWNVAAGRVVETRTVATTRSQLGPQERDSWGCTPCSEDQVAVQLSNGIRFQACGRVADRLSRALEDALSSGAIIETVVGYRPSLSRGPVDADQNRTQLSNHAFGSAIDVNEAHNGLYESCPTWGPGCRLRKGGPWIMGHPLSLSPDHPLVQTMAREGFAWGGVIAGQQKDMMHFSQSGT